MIERSTVYLDSSAIVKLIVDEPGSAELSAYLQTRPTRVSSRIAEVEVRRAAARVGPGIEKGRVDEILAGLALIELDAALASASGTLAPATLRTLDAIHLATALALALDLDTFVTYDERLARAATSAGMSVASPGVTLVPHR